MLTRRVLFAAPACAMIGGSMDERIHAMASKDTVVVAKKIDDIVSFDPAESYMTSGNEICGNCYRRLVVPHNADMSKIVGDLASWSVSVDRMTITFDLRRDAYFDSGRPVTAEDAAFSLQRAVILDERPSFIIRQFGFAKHNVHQLIRAIDDYTMTLTLPPLLATNLWYFVRPSFVLECLSASIGSVVEKSTVLANQRNNDLGNGWLKTHTAGAGSLKLTSWSASNHVVMEANPHYRANPYYRGTSDIRRVIIRHVPEPSMQLRLLRQGDVDIARDVGLEQIKAVHDDPAYYRVQAPQWSSMWISLNRSMPELNDNRIVKAIRWAIDYDDIAKNSTAGTWRVFHDSDAHPLINDNYEPLQFHKDTARARGLMAEAGLGNGITVTMDHCSSAPFADVAQVVQQNLAEIGIRVKLIAGEADQVASKEWEGQHQLAMLTQDHNHFYAADRMRLCCVQMDSIILLQKNTTVLVRQDVNGIIIGPLDDYTQYNRITKA